MDCYLFFKLQSDPSFSYSLGILSRFVSKPAEVAWKGLNHVFTYLQGTRDYCLKLLSSGPEELKCFVDSDWANLPGRKSVPGLVFKFGNSLVG